MKVTQNDLLDALKEYGKPAPRRPTGAGWYSLAELAEKQNVTVPALKYQLKVAQRRGVKVEIANGTTIDPEGRVVRQTFYRLQGKP